LGVQVPENKNQASYDSKQKYNNKDPL